MENGPFIDGLPIKNGDFQWQTVSHNQRVIYKVTLSRHFFLSNTFHWVAIGGRDQSPNRRQRRLKTNLALAVSRRKLEGDLGRPLGRGPRT